MEMVSSSKASLDLQKLPPTERAAHYYSLRVHLQVIIWKELSNNILDPKQWGWKLEESAFTPIMTDLDAAPESLLSSKNPCRTNICSCRKNGLKCVTA